MSIIKEIHILFILLLNWIEPLFKQLFVKGKRRRIFHSSLIKYKMMRESKMKSDMAYNRGFCLGKLIWNGSEGKNLIRHKADLRLKKIMNFFHRRLTLWYFLESWTLIISICVFSETCFSGDLVNIWRG